MYQPNSDAIGFCNWMLNLSRQKLTGPQRIIVEEVYNAALGNYPVSDQTWWNFNLFTPWRNQFYLVFKNYAVFTAPDLLLALLSSYNFEGNSNDSVGGNNGSDSNVSFSSLYGKINDGAYFNGVSSSIVFSPFTLNTSFTLSVWLNFQTSLNSTEVVFMDTSSLNGLRRDVSNNNLFYYNNGTLYSTSIVPQGVYFLFTLRVSLGIATMYCNNVAISAPFNISSPYQFDTLSWSTNPFSLTGFVDILNIWDRALSDDEMSMFYNGGAGIQYPF